MSVGNAAIRIGSADDVHDLQDQLKWATHEWLLRKGWKYTSSNPICAWLWEKTLTDGRVILVNTDVAVRMQDTLELLDREG